MTIRATTCKVKRRGAALPMELWPVVFVGAFLSWGLSETMARFVWREGEVLGWR
jgi:hypothetical protein